MTSKDGTVRILIVEDTPSLLKLYTHVLRQAGYQVDEAASGVLARASIQMHPPDIVLLDRVLPDADGSEIVAWIKERPQFANIFVIMLSAFKTTEDDRVSGFEAGADDYMVKPVSRRELLARIRVAMRLILSQRALQISESKHRSLAENSPDIIMRLDPTGYPTYVNQRIEAVLGLSPHAFLAGPRHNLELDGSLIDAWRAACAEVVAGRSPRQFEFSYTVHGNTYFVDTRLVPEFNQEGEVISVLAVLRDFSERVRSEQAIARLAAVVEQSMDAVIITSPSGAIEYVNRSYEQLIGCAAAELVGHALTNFAANQELDFVRRFCDALTAHTAWVGTTHLRRADGAAVDVEAHIFPILDAKQAPISSAAFLRDISDRRRNERERELVQTVASALRKATRRDEVVEIVLNQMMTLFSVAGASICAFDSKEHQLVVEQAVGDFAATVGLRLDDAGLPQRLQSSGDLLVFDQATRHIPAELSDLLPGARACVGVPLIRDKQNLGVIWVSSATAVPEQVIRLLGAIADMLANTIQRVTLFDQLERYAAELEARVDERTHELAAANQRLLELDRLKSKFVSNVSHELRTPISNLKLYLSLLQRGKTDKRAHYEAMLQTSAERLGQLVEDILNLSRLEISHFQPKEMEPTDLNAVINQVVALHQPQAETSGLRLTFEADHDLPLIVGDYNQLSQLVTNLVVNALHYTPHGAVAIKTDRLPTEPNVLLSVEDTGVGIMPEDLPHVFDRFYRGNHRQSVDIPGTGLGLAIVKEIVEIHHGEISLQSQVDIGTRVEVRLPIPTNQQHRHADA
jgi:PAS domain S-box-containing protein